ncbi:MAG: ATP-binding protein [Melioribacteraceae bacterium]|nr:ATP-binding protein [Melioribacteraceae bacterium]
MAKGRSSIEISSNESIIILSYLYDLYVKSQSEYDLYNQDEHDDEFRVTHILSIPSSKREMVEIAEFYKCTDTGLHKNYRSNTLVILVRKGTTYYITIQIERLESETKRPPREITMISIDCKHDENYYFPQDLDDYEIYRFLQEESYRKSGIHKKCFRYDYTFSPNLLDDIKEINRERLNDEPVYLPKEKLYQIEKFMKRVLVSDKAIRILLSGAPGTGKSQLIENVMHNLYGKIIIIKVQGFKTDFRMVFEFLKVFDKALLVIDDIDIFLKNREENHHTIDRLFEFLQLIDSSKFDKVHILATTNDKKMVDLAASRPGRFDVIMDIEGIKAENYMDLIKRETENNEIIESISDALLQKMEEKKVSGAFIVNFIDQLRSERFYSNSVNAEIADQYFNLLYEGFYKETRENESRLGFS